MRKIAPLILEPLAQPATRCVLFCHGLGDSAHGWIDTLRELQAQAPLRSTRFIIPTAPTRRVTINGGAPCPAWYDIRSLSGKRDEEGNCEGLEESSATLHALIGEAGVPPGKVVLAGFSQGGALSLFAGLNYRGTGGSSGGGGGGAGGGGGGGAAAGPSSGEHLGGIAVLSGYLPMPQKVSANPLVLAHTPAIFFHGDEDRVVPLGHAEDAHRRLKGARPPPQRPHTRATRATTTSKMRFTLLPSHFVSSSLQTWGAPMCVLKRTKGWRTARTRRSSQTLPPFWRAFRHAHPHTNVFFPFCFSLLPSTDPPHPPHPRF